MTSLPSFLYGTAWKEESTAELVRAALAAGFRGIDTANQRKHYFEAAVGEALAGVRRDELFLQTKFTHQAGQDHRLPYDPRAPIAEQVAQSFASSLEHLRTDYVDSYVLHGPSTRGRLAEEDWQAWRAMERLQTSGGARLLGVSNVSLAQLEELHRGAEVKPAMVQNRCFAVTGWDRGVRGFCAAHGMRYQGFSLLTANVEVLRHPRVLSIAERLGCTVPQVIFRFALDVGMLPLTGTSDPEHMRQDLAATGLRLEADDVQVIEKLAG